MCAERQSKMYENALGNQSGVECNDCLFLGEIAVGLETDLWIVNNN